MEKALEFLSKHWLVILVVLVVIAVIAFVVGGYLVGGVVSVVATGTTAKAIQHSRKLESKVEVVKKQAIVDKRTVDSGTRRAIKKGHHMTNRELVDDVMNDVDEILGGDV